MSDARRDESETPRAESRSFADEQGRRWSGFVMSGRFEGGEEYAEAVFVCEDIPSEPKRSASLDAAPAEAAERWRTMDEAGVRQVFRDSKPA